jgi:hypothetical protein
MPALVLIFHLIGWWRMVRFRPMSFISLSLSHPAVVLTTTTLSCWFRFSDSAGFDRILFGLVNNWTVPRGVTVAASTSAVNIRFNQAVVRVEYDVRASAPTSGCAATTADGAVYYAAVCVSTIPAGVLKSNTTQFVPPLPANATAALSRLQTGDTNVTAGSNGGINTLVARFATKWWNSSAAVFLWEKWAGVSALTRGAWSRLVDLTVVVGSGSSSSGVGGGASGAQTVPILSATSSGLFGGAIENKTDAEAWMSLKATLLGMCASTGAVGAPLCLPSFWTPEWNRFNCTFFRNCTNVTLYVHGQWSIPDPINFTLRTYMNVPVYNQTNATYFMDNGTAILLANGTVTVSNISVELPQPRIVTSPTTGAIESGYALTRWGSDPFSMGAATYAGLGGSTRDFAEVCAPIVDSTGTLRLVFAGEHCSAQHHGTVHGAYIEGVRAARQVIAARAQLAPAAAQYMHVYPLELATVTPAVAHPTTGAFSAPSCVVDARVLVQLNNPMEAGGAFQLFLPVSVTAGYEAFNGSLPPQPAVRAQITQLTCMVLGAPVPCEQWRADSDASTLPVASGLAGAATVWAGGFPRIAAEPVFLSFSLTLSLRGGGATYQSPYAPSNLLRNRTALLSFFVVSSSLESLVPSADGDMALPEACMNALLPIGGQTPTAAPTTAPPVFDNTAWRRSLPAVTNATVGSAIVSLKLQADVTAATTGAFQSALLTAIAGAFNATARSVARGRLSVATVSGGSVIVAVRIAPGPVGVELNVSAAAAALSAMATAGAQGVLSQSVLAALNVSLDSTFAPTIMLACTTGASFAAVSVGAACPAAPTPPPPPPPAPAAAVDPYPLTYIDVFGYFQIPWRAWYIYPVGGGAALLLAMWSALYWFCCRRKIGATLRERRREWRRLVTARLQALDTNPATIGYAEECVFGAACTIALKHDRRHEARASHPCPDGDECLLRRPGRLKSLAHWTRFRHGEVFNADLRRRWVAARRAAKLSVRALPIDVAVAAEEPAASAVAEAAAEATRTQEVELAAMGSASAIECSVVQFVPASVAAAGEAASQRSALMRAASSVMFRRAKQTAADEGDDGADKVDDGEEQQQQEQEHEEELDEVARDEVWHDGDCTRADASWNAVSDNVPMGELVIPASVAAASAGPLARLLGLPEHSATARRRMPPSLAVLTGQSSSSTSAVAASSFEAGPLAAAFSPNRKGKGAPSMIATLRRMETGASNRLVVRRAVSMAGPRSVAASSDLLGGFNRLAQMDTMDFQSVAHTDGSESGGRTIETADRAHSVFEVEIESCDMSSEGDDEAQNSDEDYGDLVGADFSGAETPASPIATEDAPVSGRGGAMAAAAAAAVAANHVSQSAMQLTASLRNLQDEEERAATSAASGAAHSPAGAAKSFYSRFMKATKTS